MIGIALWTRPIVVAARLGITPFAVATLWRSDHQWAWLNNWCRWQLNGALKALGAIGVAGTLL